MKAEPSRNAAEHVFRLLVRSTADTPPELSRIEILGQDWALSDAVEVPQREAAPDYTCISYSFGAGRATHPIDGRVAMSDRTISVIETVVAHLETAAIWADAFCIPIEVGLFVGRVPQTSESIDVA